MPATIGPSFRHVDPFGLSAEATSAVSSNEYLLPGIGAIDEQNHDLFEKLSAMREEPFFRLFSVDMLASCEYLPQELFECYSETCEIYPIDDDDVSDELW